MTRNALMRLISLNVGMPKFVTSGSKTFSTGIYKDPVEGRVMLRMLNLDGDGQADLEAHGGPNRAVYVFSLETYRFWEQELGRDDFVYGQFGENFTVEGMTEDQICVGDVFRIGSAIVEVSQPRPPCFKLNVRMGIPNFLKQFLRSGRVGFYLRVLQEGEVGAGDTFILERVAPVRMNIIALTKLMYVDTDNLEGARQALGIEALSQPWKDSFAERLAKAGV